MRRFQFAGILFVVFVAVIFSAVSLFASHAHREESGGDEQPAPLLLDPRSNPHAVISEMFYQSGYSMLDAAELATRSREIIKGHEVPPTGIKPSRKTEELPIHPDSNPHAILVEAFRASGWSLEEATKHANQAVMRIRGIEPKEDELMPLGVDCYAYKVVRVFCEDGVEKRSFEYVDGNCWDGITPCMQVVCWQGESPWFTLEEAGGGECSWFTDRTIGPSWVPCDTEILQCDDFESTDCGDIDPQCCNTTFACDGCPECE